MAQIMDYVSNKQTSECYPTPAELVRKMIAKVNWKAVKTILEPSAGKGNMLKEIAQCLNRIDNKAEVDCIEIDSNLRAILKYNFSKEAYQKMHDEKDRLLKSRGKYSEQNWYSKKYRYMDDKGHYIEYPEKEQEQLAEYDNLMNGFFHNDLHIVHDDFMTYTNYRQYNLIMMNPPFSCGDRHLIKALDMQKNGGQIVCLLNAETLKNPYSEIRKQLVSLLNQYDAEIEYLKNAFTNAERKSNVEIALIYVNIPYSENDKPSIYEQLAEAKHYEEPTVEEITDIEVTDFIKMIINRYRMEVEAGIELIKSYKRMLPYLQNTIDTSDDTAKYARPLIYLTNNEAWNCHEITVNEYVKNVRLKYWKALLTNQKFTGKLTAALQQKYRERINSYADYDFSEFNIYTLLAEMNTHIKQGIEEEIMKMYDRLTEEHSYYPECNKNRHLYSGWKTNKAWKLVKKSIVPCSGVFSIYDGTPRTYDALPLLSDIERILNFFDGNMTAEVNLGEQIETAFKKGITKNIHCKYFDATFYKKGTVHLVYTCPELIDRYNIYAAQNRKWLPPSYGEKKYEDMTAEEQSVIDAFQGKQAYEKVTGKPEFYLASPVSRNIPVMLAMN